MLSRLPSPLRLLPVLALAVLPSLSGQSSPAPTLYLPFENSLNGSQGQAPLHSSGVSFGAGIAGQAAQFASGSSLAYAPNLIDARSGTLIMWVRSSTLVSGFQFASLGSGGGLVFAVDGGGFLRIIANQYGAGGKPEEGTGFYVSGADSNAWHHVAYTWNDDALAVYFDGQLKAQTKPVNPLPQISASEFTVGPGPGAIDDLKLFSSPLNASQIQSLFLQGLTVDSLSMTVYHTELFPTWILRPELNATFAGGAHSIPIESSTLSSSNPQVLRIDAGGKIVAVAPGTALLTSSLGGRSAQAAITVKAPVLPVDTTLPTALKSTGAPFLYEIPVVILRYLPTVDGVNLDTSYDPDYWWLGNMTLAAMKANIDTYDRNVKFMLEEGTRFRGYKTPAAIRAQGYKVVGYFTVYEPTPPGKMFGGANGRHWHADWISIFDRFDMKTYVEKLGVREVWLWMGYVDQTFPSYNPNIHTPEKLRGIWESNMSSPTTGDISNSDRDNTDLPVYNKTYVAYTQNTRRTQAEAIHNHGHQLESMLSYAQSRDYDQNLLWQKFSGPMPLSGRCGNTHFPPNGRQDYDYLNPGFVLSDCEDWTPDGTGAKKQTNVDTWGLLNYAWPVPAPPQQVESQYYMYWMQNMPGLGNTIPAAIGASTIGRLNNWWNLIADWDSANRSGMGLTRPNGDYTAPSSASAPQTGGALTLSVSGGAGPWYAFSNNPEWIQVQNATGSGPGSATVTVSPNPGAARTGTVVIAEKAVTISQAGPPPVTLSLSKSALNFGSVTTQSVVTAGQDIALSISGAAAASWTATPSASWLRASPSSGTGSAKVTVTIVPGSLPASTPLTGSIAFTSPTATNSPSLSVRVAQFSPSSAPAPFGLLETPANNANVASSIPVTGWALDDIGVASVKIYRDSVAPEPAGAMVFIGNATFVPNARPDVEAAYPNTPQKYRAGWGYMLLTNFLPNGGNGAYKLYAVATSLDGKQTTLGSRTITVDNAHATKPFGAIDTPGQGESISGSSYVNFGWALTPQPGKIPVDGSTIFVWLDGVPIGNVTYNLPRTDVDGLFPGYANTGGAIGYRYMDTTLLADGMHNIAWSVTDNLGRSDGVGSRFFSVLNAVSSASSATPALARSPSTRLASGPMRAGLAYRTAYNLQAPLADWPLTTAGHPQTLAIHQMDRIEIHLPPASGTAPWQGGQRVNVELRALPVGSTLDSAHGIFYWQLGPGFLGSYALEFALEGLEPIVIPISVLAEKTAGAQQ
ncbi:MAG: hypothetical protein HY821_22300 [Acidobacteria bacterium]|nr:hypothetical protein [Acidobacteriota bacterium]